MTDASQRLDLPVGSIGRHANGWWGMMMLIVDRGGALRLSPVRLLLCGGSAQPRLAAGGPSGLQAVAPRHDRPAFEQRRRLARRALAETGAIRRRRGGLSRRRGADGDRVRRRPGAGMGGQEVHSLLEFLRIALFHHHRLSHAARRRRRSHPATLALWCALGYFNRIRSAPVSIGAIYWHFVDAVWLVLFFTFYITPRLGLG